MKFLGFTWLDAGSKPASSTNPIFEKRLNRFFNTPKHNMFAAVKKKEFFDILEKKSLRPL